MLNNCHQIYFRFNLLISFAYLQNTRIQMMEIIEFKSNYLCIEHLVFSAAIFFIPLFLSSISFFTPNQLNSTIRIIWRKLISSIWNFNRHNSKARRLDCSRKHSQFKDFINIWRHANSVWSEEFLKSN